MISVPCISLFQRLITKAIREKYKRTKRYRQYCLYRKYPSLAKNRGDQCSLMQQFTHPVHPKSSYRLRTCFGGKAGKIRNTGSRQKNANEKKQSKAKNSTEDRVHREAILFSEINCVATASPYQIACAAQFPKLSSLAAASS